ncbi:ferredoxin--NADP(+) reductase [Mycolicibacterium mageritense DSM 44476 = CIP 104973]|uniref:ferredoxin--NADP(+) reductase n=1 Tax=Mycolicibacterium mageritense TaxID=53462 RepID=A0AAI8TUD6_MYCME|nr:FAD-dependent oxidoreductase [Mycolicibacterium mageritense]MCC9181458.1 FAD-dependent oxidoreductase [Mycolicibacterium mageritense]TXI66014.1 MAG: 4Fe-4S ferredoxin [Mycolicibacterium mageritense]CDO23267.1 NADPH-dependent glutamate synthase subunit beta-like oxidoreductase [Mycolicibacterium mageritense DSM 44476 = CIP 104973]BBX32190.1 putative ferredoxin/ferredoxin--NADP reductase [Mycolicibacterium mageritense]BDY29130.1 putative ferredoxin/ferredoxin--NADP reductase [Mycolicibacteriu
MPHVITQSCCSDAACVYACPVNCIHPTPDEPDFHTAQMLYVDPAECVDCGACVSACPVDAIKPHTKLAGEENVFATLNADFYTTPRPRPILAPVVPPLEVRSGSDLRVAIVGSGPAAMYAADEVLTIPGARVRMYERLTQPYGLARFGVAPDHRRTRGVARQFDHITANPRLDLRLGVEVGADVSHDDLLAEHHAVIYAVGASTDRRLDIPGADLPGVTSATEFVAWYNGHPDYAGRSFDLSSSRVVIVGNGNVALDVARILTIDPDRLADTDIAPHALKALRDSRIAEVVVVGRRGIEQSAFTVPELVGLCSTPGVDVVVRDEDLRTLPDTDPRAAILRDVRSQVGNRRIALEYLLSPTTALGETATRGVEFTYNELITAPDGSPRVKSTGRQRVIEAGLVLTSIGYRATPVPGLPFDDSTATVPHDAGRVPGVHGAFVTGWIKRGPTGFIGTNKSCAQETVRSLVADYNSGLLG